MFCCPHVACDMPCCVYVAYKLPSMTTKWFIIRDSLYVTQSLTESKWKLHSKLLSEGVSYSMLQYVFFSLMSWKDKDGLNKRRMLEVVRANEGDEFLSYFPQVTLCILCWFQRNYSFKITQFTFITNALVVHFCWFERNYPFKITEKQH
jgi:hypothetical protein